MQDDQIAGLVAGVVLELLKVVVQPREHPLLLAVVQGGGVQQRVQVGVVAGGPVTDLHVEPGKGRLDGVEVIEDGAVFLLQAGHGYLRYGAEGYPGRGGVSGTRGGLAVVPEGGVLDAGTALSAVRTEDLVSLLRAVHRREVVCPVTPKTLAEGGLLRLQDAVGFLGGLDRRGVTAVLVAVIAERRRR